MSKTCKLVSIFSETSLLASEYSVKPTSACVQSSQWIIDGVWTVYWSPGFTALGTLPAKTSMPILYPTDTVLGWV